MYGKRMIAFFSASPSRRTATVAHKIADVTGADLYEIRPLIPYTEDDLDWDDKTSRVNVEMHDPACRPQIEGELPDLAPYETVFVGFPLWWFAAPHIINTFLEAHDFKGKTIIPFFTSYSSGPGETDKNLHKSIIYDVTWKSAVRVNRWNDKELKDWVSHCGKFVSHL